MQKNKYWIISLGLCCGLFLFNCGKNESTRINANTVLGIPFGDKEGTGLSGDFTVLINYTKNNCKNYPQLQGPEVGDSVSANLVVDQNEGAIRFNPILANLRGGVYFDNSFETGGTLTLSSGGFEDNILSFILFEGEFDNANEFHGKATQRFIGRIDQIEVDCDVKFEAEGIRQ